MNVPGEFFCVIYEPHKEALKSVVFSVCSVVINEVIQLCPVILSTEMEFIQPLNNNTHRERLLSCDICRSLSMSGFITPLWQNPEQRSVF